MIGEERHVGLSGHIVTPMPPWEKRPKPRPAGRVCAEDGCFTRLSIYNKAEVCFQHQPKDFINYARRGRRKSA